MPLPEHEENRPRMSGGKIAAIVVAVTLSLLLLVVGVCFVVFVGY